MRIAEGGGGGVGGGWSLGNVDEPDKGTRLRWLGRQEPGSDEARSDVWRRRGDAAVEREKLWAPLGARKVTENEDAEDRIAASKMMTRIPALR